MPKACPLKASAREVISSRTAGSAAQAAVEALKQLDGCEIHLSHFPGPGDEAGLRNLGLNATSDPVFAGKAAPLP